MVQIIESVNRPFASALVDYAESNLRAVCVTNDLTKSVEVDDFRQRFPDRYFSLGMAEQNLVGVVGGLAREGLEPFYPSFAVFATRRPYEQIALNVAYPNLRVRLMGFLSGLTTPGGVTHQATDDLALMTTLPNMTVISLADATDVQTFLPELSAVDGPVYCQLPRGSVPRLFTEPFRLGEPRVVTEGSDVLIISTGATSIECMAATEILRHHGVSPRHVNLSTLKPLNRDRLVPMLTEAGLVVTAENHLIRGGLGSLISELIAEEAPGVVLRRVGIRDTFTHGGSSKYLFGYYQINAKAISDAVAGLMGLPDVSTDGSDLTGYEAVGESQAEGL
jgi:transketolase